MPVTIQLDQCQYRDRCQCRTHWHSSIFDVIWLHKTIYINNGTDNNNYYLSSRIGSLKGSTENADSKRFSAAGITTFYIINETQSHYVHGRTVSLTINFSGNTL